MRALLIGIGGAGSRIVNMLLTHEEKSSVKSVRAYIFDADRENLNVMAAVDADKRIYLSPSSVETEVCLTGYDFDINHISGYFDDSIADEADAVFICAGLGGRMAETIPGILKQLNVTFADPVYTILTLPARNEGARVSARAAATLSEIRKEATASILFDNETWIQRLEEGDGLKADKKQEKGEEEESAQPAKLSIQDAASKLNELLTRRVELLLRAGEITPDGLESAEAVLDAGEVLNTLADSDIVSIGYAAERIPKSLLGFFNRFRMEKYLLEEGQKRTARIVELAKQAVYEEVSIPCDLTTANKALVLITGPSNELSMKGFQTIRKWIDRSIKGLEMRAGDYPVHSSRDVGVIIVLAGIENVPRLAELNEIKASYEEEVGKKYRGVNDQTDEITEPKLRPAADKELFEEGEVLSTYINVPFLEPAAETPGPNTPYGKSIAAAVMYPQERPDENQYDDIWEVGMSDTDVFEECVRHTATQYTGTQLKKKTNTSPEMKTDSVNPGENEDIFEKYPKQEEVPENRERECMDVFKETSVPAEGDDCRDVFEEAPVPAEREDGEDVFEEAPVPAEKEEPGDIFEETPVTAKKEEEKDFFEEHPVIPHPVTPVYGEEKEPAGYSYTDRTETPGAEDVAKAPDSSAAAASHRRPDEKISLGPAKERKVKADDKIPLPPRNKQPDMVLAGQADLGMRKTTREAGDRVSPGSGKRPKETERDVSVGSGQRPKETEREVTVGSGQRPKDSDGAVAVKSGQRPNDADGNVSVGSGQRPNDADGAVAVRPWQKPKDGVGSVRIGTGQRPKEIGSIVRISSGQKPKEPGNVIRISQKQQTKETLSPVRTAQKQTKVKEEKISGTARGMKWM
ncbi:MAG: tubulin/FtsZ family protein [Methanocorpusculum sp.]|nr:tubulin/FtsZ family protein [Methanocorpusculum sp.]